MVQANAQVDLIATQDPNTTAIAETVVVTIPVTFAHNLQLPGGILRLQLTIEQAEYLAAQIQPVLKIARSYAQQMSSG